MISSGNSTLVFNLLFVYLCSIYLHGGIAESLLGTHQSVSSGHMRRGSALVLSFTPTQQWVARGLPPTTRSLPSDSFGNWELLTSSQSWCRDGSQESSQMELGIVTDLSSRALLSHISV